MTRRRRFPWLATLLLVGATGSLAWFPRVAAVVPSTWADAAIPVAPVGLFLALGAVAAIAFLRVAAFVWRNGDAQDTGSRSRVGVAILAVALLMRAPALVAPPWLSDDVWRYLWEGTVGRAGFSPYVHAPDALELTPLRDEVHARVTHREVSAVYPPVAQLLFRVVPESVTAWKCVVVAADLALMEVLRRALARRRWPPWRLLLYAANPLVALAGAASGHVDVIAWLPMFVGLLLIARTDALRLRRFAAGVATGFAALLKPQAIAPLVQQVRRRDLFALGGVALALALGFAPFLRDGGHLFAGTARYAHDWEFNGLVYPPMVRLAEALKRGLEALPDQPLHLWKVRELGYAIVPNQLARELDLLLFALVVVALSRVLARDPVAIAFAVLATFLATTPAVHPWYVAWLVPFAPLLPHRAARAALLLSLTTLAAYVVRLRELESGRWEEPRWLALVTWAPPCLLAAYDLWTSDSTRGDHDLATDGTTA